MNHEGDISGASVGVYGNQVFSNAHVTIGHTYNYGEKKKTEEVIDKNKEESKEEEIKRFLKSLHFPEMYDRLMNIREAVDDTCDWLFSNQEYENWINRISMEIHRGLLWIKGKPGAGKSTLMKEALRRTKERNKGTAKTSVEFYFNARATQKLEKARLGLLRSILHQVLQQDVEALGFCLSKYLQKSKTQSSKVIWHESELRELIFHIYTTSVSKPAYIFIDALDECDENEVHELVNFLRKLTTKAWHAGAQLNVCISSRHYPQLSIEDCPEIVVERYNEQDILTYIRSESRNIQTISVLQDKIFRKSRGIFLWVVLVMAMLQKSGRGRSHKWMERKLDEIPLELGALFRKTFEHFDIEKTHKTVHLFQWILFAKDRPRLSYIHRALGFEANNPYPSLQAWKDSEDYLTEDQQLEMVTDLSRGLLETVLDHTNNREIQFIHETARDFFLEGEGFKVLDHSFHGSITGKGHSSIAQTCINYLDTLEMKALVARIDSPGPHPLDNLDLSEEIVQTQAPHDPPEQPSRTAPTQPERRAPPEMSPQDDPGWAANKREMVETLAQITAGMNQQAQQAPRGGGTLRADDIGYFDPDVEDLAQYASCHVLFHIEGAETHGIPQNKLLARFWHENSLLKALRFDQSYEFHKKDTILFRCWRRSLWRCVRRLCSMGVNVNECTDSFHQYLLLEAISRLSGESPGDSDRETVRLLLEARAKLELRDRWGRTALHTTVTFSQEDVTERLLACGADVNAVDDRGDTPLHCAALWCGESTLRMLLARGADVHAINGNRKTPLHIAARGCSKNVLQMLLDSGAGVNAIDGDRKTSLHIAIDCSQGSLAETLLAYGADANATDNEGETPLHKIRWNSENGRQMMQVLLNHGAQINVQNRRGEPALHYSTIGQNDWGRKDWGDEKAWGDIERCWGTSYWGRSASGQP